mgnify:CR=1 FL=1
METNGNKKYALFFFNNLSYLLSLYNYFFVKYFKTTNRNGNKWKQEHKLRCIQFNESFINNKSFHHQKIKKYIICKNMLFIFSKPYKNVI